MVPDQVVIDLGANGVTNLMSQIVYILRKPAPEGIVRAASTEGTGGFDLDALRPPSGNWPTNMLIEHHGECTDVRCVKTCPLQEAENKLGSNVASFSVINPPEQEVSPW